MSFHRRWRAADDLAAGNTGLRAQNCTQPGAASSNGLRGGGAHQLALVSAAVIDAAGEAAGCQKLGAGSASGVPPWLDNEPQLEERRPPSWRMGVGFSGGGSGSAASASFVACDSVSRESAAAAAAADARSPK
jgi:hypothetical protein